MNKSASFEVGGCRLGIAFLVAVLRILSSGCNDISDEKAFVR